MTHEDLQAILGAMLQSGEGVSDCLFLNGKPPLVERYGKLHELPMEGPDTTLQSAHLDAMANLLLDDSTRLRADLTDTGSCDTSYALPGIARFRSTSTGRAATPASSCASSNPRCPRSSR